MDLHQLTDTTVRQAIEALQVHDKAGWYAHFTADAVFTDDGRTMDFRTFFDNAIAKKEKFLDIDTVSADGKQLHGRFFAGQWGTFRVYFKFHVNADGRIHQLDIGQAAR